MSGLAPGRRGGAGKGLRSVVGVGDSKDPGRRDRAEVRAAGRPGDAPDARRGSSAAESCHGEGK